MNAVRRDAQLGWGPVSYLEWAAGAAAATVVLLHGGGVDSAELSWGEIGPALAAAGYRVIAPDHPGYGNSPSAPWPSTQDNLVSYVGEFVDSLQLGRYAIGGLSLGGGMTIGHVLARHEKVSGAILLGSYGIMPRLSDGPLSLLRQVMTCAMVRTGALDSMSRWLATNRLAMSWSMSTLVRDPARRTPALMDAVASAARRGNGFDAFAQWQRDQVRWSHLATDYIEDLSAFSRPALIIHGDKDTGVPLTRAVNAARLIPDARLEVIAGAGHWVQRDCPSAVLAAMIDFLSATT